MRGLPPDSHCANRAQTSPLTEPLELLAVDPPLEPLELLLPLAEDPPPPELDPLELLEVLGAVGRGVGAGRGLVATATTRSTGSRTMMWSLGSPVVSAPAEMSTGRARSRWPSAPSSTTRVCPTYSESSFRSIVSKGTASVSARSSRLTRVTTTRAVPSGPGPAPTAARLLTALPAAA